MRDRSMRRRSRAAGLSLIEAMIALLVGSLLMFGLVQLFTASQGAYRLSESLSRVQENGRFAVDFLQRDLRMAGHFGCVNDQAHMRAEPFGLATTFAEDGIMASVANAALRFDVSVAGFDAAGTAPGQSIRLAEAETGWNNDLASTPFAAATDNRVPGSDIIVLRYLVPDGVPVTEVVTAAPASFARPGFRFDAARHWDVLRSGLANPGLFAVADCLSATVFQASGDPSSGTLWVGDSGAAPFNLSGLTHLYDPGQVMLHRVESIVYYVGRNDSDGRSLYRSRYVADPGGTGRFQRDELVEGIENMQVLYGLDRVSDLDAEPSGFISTQSVALSGAESTPERWRRVGAVQVALLGVGDARVAAEADAAPSPVLLGSTIEVPDDGRLRAVYQSTVAIRNRLHGN